MLTPEQVTEVTTKVTKAVAAALPATPAPQATTNVQQIDKDPAMAQADEAEATLLKGLANPKYMMVRGRKGCQLVNVTQQGLDAISNWKKERNQYNNTIFVK